MIPLVQSGPHQRLSTSQFPTAILHLARLARWPAVALAWGLFAMPAVAVDPPHTDGDDYCASCHLVHRAPGTPLLNTPGGNVNLCQSCHVPGGSASAKALVNSDQAVPWPGLPAGVAPSGTSHRWDSGTAGRVVFMGGAAVPSTGAVQSQGAFTGPYAKTYTLTITSEGNVGTAQFNWSATTPGGGSGASVLTGTNVLLNEGVSVAFTDSTNPPSFRLGDSWRIFVRTDLRNPTNAALLVSAGSGQMMCSSCHDPHSQQNTPFDPTAPAYSGPDTGAGRHYQAIANNADQMCLDCHAPRNVTNSIAGSHPVRVTIPVNAYYRNPSQLPLATGSSNVLCQTCHEVHFAVDTDGALVRMTNRLAFCVDCHALADTTTPARHFNTATSALWPGGQYGSTFPAITDTTLRGACENCHQAHGWPNYTNTATAYAKLLVDQEENLCFTCHDANGPAVTNVKDDFNKLRRHPINDAQQIAGRVVECNSCHNPHKAIGRSHTYTTIATAARNQVTGPLRGADGVAFNYSGLTNFQAVVTNRYTYIPRSTGVVFEYQVCFKCHSTYSWGTGTPPNGQSPNGSVANPVETDAAQEFSPMNRSGHPIMTGLNNYPNSTTPKALAVAALKAPWTNNVGTQTMLCCDCHNTDAATPAAQGPHGSAAQFMLRGANAANWPNLTMTSANFNISWCANCHNNSARGAHNSDHSGRRCYNCHIVVPHGGKMSRLIADRDGTMPARYAYNNDLTQVSIYSFTKAASSYSGSNCRVSCGEHSSGSSTSMENW